jgi:intracellular septation protein
MQVLFEFLPLILFLGAYLYKGIYFALGVLMVAMPVGLAVKYMKTRKIDKMYLWSTVFLLIAGSATFYFDDPKFLYWKPTAFYWVVAVAFLVSMWVGDRPLVRRAFDMADDLPTDQISRSQWMALNLVWVLFFAFMGLLNIYVAYNYPEEFWVKFKVFGLMGITVVFMLGQSFWMLSKMDLPEESDGAGQE